MHRPRFYALLWVYSLTNTSLTTNPNNNNKYRQYIKLSSYAATEIFEIFGGRFLFLSK